LSVGTEPGRSHRARVGGSIIQKTKFIVSLDLNIGFFDQNNKNMIFFNRGNK
jgi:hypothetical protein